VSDNRPYPPDWLDEAAAAYLFSMGASTFRAYVSQGLLPEGIKIGGKRLWSRASVNAALENLANPALTSPVDKAIKGLIDGEKAKGRRHAA
jgi:predicted DNA-binding transcriptional regulator AlpA